MAEGGVARPSYPVGRGRFRQRPDGLNVGVDPDRRAAERSGSAAMEFLIWIGAAMTLAGVAGLGGCIWLAIRARRAGLGQASMQAELQRVVTLNVAALGVSALGLAAVVMGIVLR